MLSTKQKHLVNRLVAAGHRYCRSKRQALAGECLLCYRPVKTPWDLCTACWADLPFNTHCCSRCAEPLPSQANPLICASCQEKPPAFDQVFAPFLYQPPLDRLLLSFKKHAQRTAGSLLVDLLLFELEKYELNENSPTLLAIPGQTSRIRQRGIDPPSWLAQRLSWQLGLAFEPQKLKRCKKTKSQQQLSRKKRWLNPQGAFYASDVEGRRLLLIDDVVTTGATCHWAARELKNKGAAEVTVIATCRTPF